MYKAIYQIQKDCILENKIFVPFYKCYQIHNYRLSLNGQILQWNTDWIIYSSGFIDLNLSYKTTSDWSIIVDIDYFYKSQIHTIFPSILNKNKILFENNTIQQKRFEIISQHYVDGQFSLDNWLYKEAVQNFATVVEVLLNPKLDDSQMLHKRITNFWDQTIKLSMNYIRVIRNKIHPNKLLQSNICTQQEATKCRNELEKILYYFCS